MICFFIVDFHNYFPFNTIIYDQNININYLILSPLILLNTTYMYTIVHVSQQGMTGDVYVSFEGNISLMHVSI